MNPFQYQLSIALSDGRKHVTEVRTTDSRGAAQELARRVILSKHGATEIVTDVGDFVVLRTREIVSVTLLELL